MAQVNDREEALHRLRWSVERLRYLYLHCPDAPQAEVDSAWEEHIHACRRFSRIADGMRR